MLPAANVSSAPRPFSFFRRRIGRPPDSVPSGHAPPPFSGPPRKSPLRGSAPPGRADCRSRTPPPPYFPAGHSLISLRPPSPPAETAFRKNARIPPTGRSRRSPARDGTDRRRVAVRRPTLRPADMATNDRESRSSPEERCGRHPGSLFAPSASSFRERRSSPQGNSAKTSYICRL